MADKAIKSLFTFASLVEFSPRYTSQPIHQLTQSLYVSVRAFTLFHFLLDDENRHDICWCEYACFKFRPKYECQCNTFPKIIHIFKSDFIGALLLFIDEIHRLCAECVHFMMDCLFYLLVLIRSVKLISAMPKTAHACVDYHRQYKNTHQ